MNGKPDFTADDDPDSFINFDNSSSNMASEQIKTSEENLDGDKQSRKVKSANIANNKLQNEADEQANVFNFNMVSKDKRKFKKKKEKHKLNPP